MGHYWGLKKYCLLLSEAVVSCLWPPITDPEYLRSDIYQPAKKVVSDSAGLVDFAIRLVNSVLNLPDGQVLFFFWQIQITIGINPLIKKGIGAS